MSLREGKQDFEHADIPAPKLLNALILCTCRLVVRGLLKPQNRPEKGVSIPELIGQTPGMPVA